MASAGLIVGLIAAIVVAIFLIFCCFRSITKDKEKLMRQIKQVRGVNDVDIDDIEASAPPSEEQPPGTKEYGLNGQDAEQNAAVFAYSQPQEGVESEGR